MPNFFQKLNWCGGNRSSKKQGGEGAATTEEHDATGANGSAADQAGSIKRLDELEKLYKVDWSREGFLGRGHFAEVFRGEHIETSTPVAVKRISRQNQDVKTLRQEIAALLKVNGHPSIVKLYDVFIDASLVVLCMELLAGGELFSRIVDNGAYSERDASKHFKKICEALKFMHERGIVHRDLKPENLVLETTDPDSNIKISDFGLSKVLGDDEEFMKTVCGTSAYAAPEIGLLQQYGAKVDTWSFGVILYVVLAAYHPFDPFGRLDDMGLRQAVCGLRWDFKDKVWDTMSDDVKDLISKLLCPVENRLDANEILEHPWIKKYEQLPQRPLRPDMSSRSLAHFISTGFDANWAPNGAQAQQQQQQQQQHQQGQTNDGDVVMDMDIEPLPFDGKIPDDAAQQQQVMMQ